MVDVIGNRALPSSFQGVAIHSEELNNLAFDLATFDRNSPRTEQSQRKFRTEYANGIVETDHVYTGGITYHPVRQPDHQPLGAPRLKTSGTSTTSAPPTYWVTARY